MIVRKANPRDIRTIRKMVWQYWNSAVEHEKLLGRPYYVILVTQESISKGVVGTCALRVDLWNRTGSLLEIAVERDRLRKRGSVRV